MKKALYGLSESKGSRFVGTFVPLTLALLECLIGQSCKTKSAENPESDIKGIVAEGREFLWPNATASVCWENDIPPIYWHKFEPMRKKIEQHVSSQMARAGFTLTGWLACEPNSKGMRIAQKKSQKPHVKYEQASVEAFGYKLDGVVGGIKLYMDFYYDSVLLNTALHEFGHAIGLQHEHLRPDSQCNQKHERRADLQSMGSLLIGSYDSESIMNYCYVDQADIEVKTVGLSAGDISTIKTIYSNTRSTQTFPRENKCIKDGNLWVTKKLRSCCKIAPGNKPPNQAEYPICKAHFPWISDSDDN